MSVTLKHRVVIHKKFIQSFYECYVRFDDAKPVR